MARLTLGLLVPLAGSSGVISFLLFLVVCGLLVVTVRWDKARQRRLLEDPEYEQREAIALIQREEERMMQRMSHLYIEGMNGQIEVDDEWVRISRRGLGGHLTRGVFGLLGGGVQIHLSDIEDIEISYPRFYVRGWLRFLTGGEDRIGIQEAAKDPKTVLFTGRKQVEFDNFRQQLKGLIALQANEGLVQAIAEGVAATATVRGDFATQLRELGALRDEGLLTEEEFQLKKAQLLRDG